MANMENDRLKWRFPDPKGAISRRQLLKLVVPRSQVIPFVESARCPGSRDCGLCYGSCPQKAIETQGVDVIINTTLCCGCGACVAACPFRAIDYPGYSPQQLDQRMADGLSANNTAQPGIVAFVCRNCSMEVSVAEQDKPSFPGNVVCLEVPCRALVSPWLMLRAFDRGAQGLVTVFGSDRCSTGFDGDSWRADIDFVQGLLVTWGIEAERIKMFSVAGEAADFAKGLEGFTVEINSLVETAFAQTEATLIPENGLLLPDLIRGMDDKVAGSMKRTVTEGKVPFGSLAIDTARCSGCGLCALDCPTGALAFTSDEDNNNLFFHHDLCIACGQCPETCPEGCLHLERVLDLDKIKRPAAVLFEDSVVRCRQCGVPVASRAMISRLQLKLADADNSLAAQLELCPQCKVGQFKLEKTVLEPVAGPD